MWLCSLHLCAYKVYTNYHSQVSFLQSLGCSFTAPNLYKYTKGKKCSNFCLIQIFGSLPSFHNKDGTSDSFSWVMLQLFSKQNEISQYLVVERMRPSVIMPSQKENRIQKEFHLVSKKPCNLDCLKKIRQATINSCRVIGCFDNDVIMQIYGRIFQLHSRSNLPQ